MQLTVAICYSHESCLKLGTQLVKIAKATITKATNAPKGNKLGILLTTAPRNRIDITATTVPISLSLRSSRLRINNQPGKLS